VAGCWLLSKRISQYLFRVISALWRWFWRLTLGVVATIVVLLLVFKWLPVPTSSFMLQQQIHHVWNGNVPAVNHYWLDWDAISPEMKLAVIAAEDQQFPHHWGIDQRATTHAIRSALNGKDSGGGSTITQQVAKNLFLWSGRSYVRKGLEWGLALLIEALWSKQRILEVYLNIAQFSASSYGVGAASEAVFKKEASTLQRREAAALAAVLPAPARYSVVKPSRYVRSRQRFIQRQMRQLGGTTFLRMILPPSNDPA